MSFMLENFYLIAGTCLLSSGSNLQTAFFVLAIIALSIAIVWMLLEIKRYFSQNNQSAAQNINPFDFSAPVTQSSGSDSEITAAIIAAITAMRAEESPKATATSFRVVSFRKK